MLVDFIEHTPEILVDFKEGDKELKYNGKVYKLVQKATSSYIKVNSMPLMQEYNGLFGKGFTLRFPTGKPLSNVYYYVEK